MTAGGGGPQYQGLPRVARILAVCAHPDDESFGLGAVIAAFAEAGAQVAVLCFTHGDASTLHGTPGDLADVRAEELDVAARCLGVERTELLDYADGRLTEARLEDLAAHVRLLAIETRAELLLAFDEGGITGHPDHVWATEAALEASTDLDLDVLGWALPEEVAQALRTEFGVGFVGREPGEIDLEIVVDRSRQIEAIARHASQSADNPALWRRLELVGNAESLRHLRRRGRDVA